MVTVFAQAAEQWRGQGSSEVQPVSIAGVRLAAVGAAQQPCGDALAIAIGHQKTIGIPKYAMQTRVFTTPIGGLQAQRRRTVETVQAGAEPLTGVPEQRGVMVGVLAVDHPALIFLIEQGEGDTRDTPALRDAAQLFIEHLGQAAEAAHAQLLTYPAGQLMVLFALFGPVSAAEQIADIHGMQQPAVLVGFYRRPGVQDVPGYAVEIQVEAVALPIGRHTFHCQGAMGTQKVVQAWRVHRVPQLRAQRAADLQHMALSIQLHVQTGSRGQWRVDSQRATAAEQAPEEFVAGTQNCRLDWACNVTGNCGTVPMPGRTIKGMTDWRLADG